MSRFKTFDSTGIATGGRLYAGDLNAIQDRYADLSDFTQTHDVSTLRVGASDVQLSRFGTSEAQFSGHLRSVGILRGLGGIVSGAFTTTQRDAIAAGSRPYGMVILNTTTNRIEWNSGSDAVPAWVGVGAAKVATTVAGLGTATDGTPGVLRIGASPYDFIGLTYDATYGKWVGAFSEITQILNVGTTSGSYVEVGGDNWSAYKVFADAGLTLQASFSAIISQSTAVGTMGVELGYATANDGATNFALTAWPATEILFIVPDTNAVFKKGTGWQSLPAVTSRDALRLGVFLKSGNAGVGTALIAQMIVKRRWVA